MSLQNLTEQLADAARDLGSEDVEHTLERAVALAVDLIEGCDGVGVTLARRGEPLETKVSTADFVARCDALQHELGEGPCMDAVWEHDTVISTDLAKEERWTTWGPRVVEELGIRSMLCLQLYVEDDNLGALNLYSKQHTGALTEDDNRYEAQALAAHVSVALAAAQEIEHLHHAVTSRTIIGQAEGIMMERFDITAEKAFEVLKRVSSQANVKLYRIAAEIVRTRQMPTANTPGTGTAQRTGAPEQDPPDAAIRDLFPGSTSR